MSQERDCRIQTRFQFWMLRRKECSCLEHPKERERKWSLKSKVAWRAFFYKSILDVTSVTKFLVCDCTTFSNSYTQKSKYEHHGELTQFIMETTRALESVDASLTKLEFICTCNFVTQYEIPRSRFSRMTFYSSLIFHYLRNKLGKISAGLKNPN